MEFREKELFEKRKSMELVFKKYKSSLFFLSFNILRDIEEAEDTVQETFLKALKNIKKLKSVENIKSWLHSIAYRIAVDKERKNSLFQRKICGIGRILEENDWEAFNEYRNEILESTDLNSMEKKAICLRLEGFKGKEIGEIIGCSESTVRVHLFNARKKLKKLFKEG